MPVVHRNALVPYSPQQMFALVADVESYPRFLPWCSRATVHARDGDAIRASIEMARGPVRKTFTTRNTMTEGRQICVDLVDGPFRRLRGEWRFEPLRDSGCRVSLDLEFEFSNRLVQGVIGPLFNEIANSLVDAFCKRAVSLYDGRNGTPA